MSHLYFFPSIFSLMIILNGKNYIVVWRMLVLNSIDAYWHKNGHYSMKLENPDIIMLPGPVRVWKGSDPLCLETSTFPLKYLHEMVICSFQQSVLQTLSLSRRWRMYVVHGHRLKMFQENFTVEHEFCVATFPFI